MNENIIQNQITLVAFKTVKVEYSCTNIEDPSDTSIKTDTIFELQLSDLLINNSPNHFAKVFKVVLKTKNTTFPETININVEFHTVFQCSEKINEEFLNSDFSKISAPAIGFPYLRAFITNLSIQAGIAPIILPSINFVQFHNESKGK